MAQSSNAVNVLIHDANGKKWFSLFCSQLEKKFGYCFNIPQINKFRMHFERESIVADENPAVMKKKIAAKQTNPDTLSHEINVFGLWFQKWF